MNELWRQEELFWQQRSRINWLQLEDKNTNFFHRATLERRAINKIMRIRNNEREWVDQENEVMVCFLDFYKRLFKAEDISRVEEALVELIVSMIRTCRRN